MVDQSSISRPDSGSRKFTLSCSRCRASKLKCDRKEPCMECVKRKIGHLCTKDERQPRTKKAKTDHQNRINNIRTSSVNNVSHSPKTETQETAQLLERFVDGPFRNDADPFTTSAFPSTSFWVAPDHSNGYWLNDDSRRQGEKLALAWEIVYAMPELDMIHHLYDIFITRCQGPLGNVVHTQSFMKQTELLYGCLGHFSPEARVTALCDTMSMDTLGFYLLALVLGLAFHPTPSILGWSPTPLALRVEELRESDVHSRTWRSLALHCLYGGASLFCGSIASLQSAIMLLLCGQEGSLSLDAILATAISGARKLGLHRLGVAKLQSMTSATAFSGEEDSSMSAYPPHIQMEIGVRIWWALVMRDWSRGQALGYYSIHPVQFDTRMPLHVNDDDLCLSAQSVHFNGQIFERPRSEFTTLSYTLYTLELAVLTRESIDMSLSLGQRRPEDAKEGSRIRNHLNQRYDEIVVGLPSYFRLGSTVGLTATGPMAAIPVQRWMLHQQLWGLFLRLHRASISSPVGRPSCQLLAQSIISTQAQIQTRCAVCGSLSTSETQLFNAAVVLLIDLLIASEQKDVNYSNFQLNRFMARDKIREAIELLRTQGLAGGSSLHDPHVQRLKGSAHRSVAVLEALMNLLEDNFDINGVNGTENGSKERVESDTGGAKPLKSKVIDILKNLCKNTNVVTAPRVQQQSSFNSPYPLDPLDTSAPSSPIPDGSHDLDVLPILSNDPSSEFWQLLDFPVPPDFPPEIDPYLAPVDLQSLVG